MILQLLAPSFLSLGVLVKKIRKARELANRRIKKGCLKRLGSCRVGWVLNRVNSKSGDKEY
jgi:hypothetical protein